MENRIVRFVRSFVLSYTQRGGVRTGYRDPLVGFASARDPLFGTIAERQPGHMLPSELLDNAASVVSCFIPFSPETAESNLHGERCSREWVYAYSETNTLIEELNRALSAELGRFGIRCRGIDPTHEFDRKTLTSRWSHRHAAFVAGLGTLGVHNLLITERGCCGRLGSMIVDRTLSPTKRPGVHCCLYFHNGSCLRCVERCTFGALSLHEVGDAEGVRFDRHRCYEVCLENAATYRETGLADICGKCAVGVPCAVANPVRE